MMEQQPPPKRGPGRPPKQSEVKRAYYQTRIRQSLKWRLEETAAENGRSLSEEIEFRLELSFIVMDLIKTYASGNEPGHSVLWGSRGETSAKSG
jgi:hypothetical protein